MRRGGPTSTKKGIPKRIDPDAEAEMDAWEEREMEKLERKARFNSLPPEQQWELLVAAVVDRNRWVTCHTITVGIS